MHDLPQQARERVAMLLAKSKDVVLNHDQPWKRSARRLMAGRDISLGELTEIFRALGHEAILADTLFPVRFPNGEMLFASGIDQIVTMQRLLKGEVVDGMTLSLANRNFIDQEAATDQAQPQTAGQPS